MINLFYCWKALKYCQKYVSNFLNQTYDIRKRKIYTFTCEIINNSPDIRNWLINNIYYILQLFCNIMQPYMSILWDINMYLCLGFALELNGQVYSKTMQMRLSWACSCKCLILVQLQSTKGGFSVHQMVYWYLLYFSMSIELESG